MKIQRAGALLWLFTFQYFVVQCIVAATFIGQFSWTENTISDLGNSVCGMYADRYVCSPDNVFMNVSFIILGLSQLLGAAALYLWLRKRKTILGFIAMILAGIGTIIVGIYPENTTGPMHVIGAALPFIFGNVAVILLGKTLHIGRRLRLYSYASGFVGLIALGLFVSGIHLGIGHGGIERVAAYPQTIWMIVTGLYYLRMKPM